MNTFGKLLNPLRRWFAQLGEGQTGCALFPQAQQGHSTPLLRKRVVLELLAAKLG